MIAEQTSAGPPGGRLFVTVLLLALGLALLVWQVRALEISPADLRAGFSAVGGWFAVILLLSLVRFALRAYAWRVLTDRPLAFRTVLAATIGGDALGNVTPLGLLASEPAKALYLRRVVDPAYALAALTAENFFYSVSVALYVIVATGAMLALFPIGPDVYWAGVTALGGMAVVLAGAAWLAWQRPTIASHVLARVPLPKLSAVVERVRVFERATYGAAGPHRSRLATVGVCEAGFHALSFVECWLTFWLLTGVSSLLPALIFDGFNRVVNVVFKPIPFRLGVEEGGTALLATAIGLPASGGFLLGLVRKARVIAWAGVGLALWSRRTLHREPAPRTEGPPR
jgi:hypothetical protein